MNRDIVLSGLNMGVQKLQVKTTTGKEFAATDTGKTIAGVTAIASA